jgi:hypothetical protein
MGGTVNMTAATGVATLDACADICGQKGDCQYLTYYYSAKTCSLKIVTPM